MQSKSDIDDIKKWYISGYRTPDNINTFLNEKYSPEYYEKLQRSKKTIKLSYIYPRISSGGEYYSKAQIIDDTKNNNADDDDDDDSEEYCQYVRLLIPSLYFDNMLKYCSSQEEEVYRLEGCTLLQVHICRDNNRIYPSNTELSDIIILYPNQLIKDSQCKQTKVTLSKLKWDNINNFQMEKNNVEIDFMNNEFSTAKYILHCIAKNIKNIDKKNNTIRDIEFYLKPRAPRVSPFLYVELYDYYISKQMKIQREENIPKSEWSDITLFDIHYVQVELFDNAINLKSMEDRMNNNSKKYF